MIIWLVTALYVICAVITIVIEYKNTPQNDTQVKYATMKCVTSILFLVIAVLAFALTGNGLFFLLLPAYILCFFGDLFLALGHEIDNRLKNPQFVIGVFSFCAAQVVLCIVFLSMMDWHVSWPAIVALLVLGGTIFFTKSDDYDFGSNAVPCSIYAFFVGLSAGLGLQLVITCSSDPVAVLLGVGAIVFLLSDLVLTMKLFWKKDVPWAGAVLLVLYWGAMWLYTAAPAMCI
ncbi:MAG: lysoplasmalogenase family protein [Bacillota bacterium]|nr:lysoplasmalogenase family protein [Bacillota bacterium]